MFDDATGIIHIKRDHPYLNNYNKWFSIMTRGNHDVQFLFTKNHALAIVYYIMKYISKPEAALHSKLTICAAMRKTMAASPQRGSDSYIAKMMLLKTYNKLDSLREVGVPEAISHLLKFPDHYTDATFVNIHTTHILQHMHDLAQHRDVEHDVNSDVEDDEFNSEIVVTDRGFCSVSRSTIMHIAGRNLLSIACMTIVHKFISTESSAVFPSTVIILSMRITVNSFEKLIP